MSEVIASRVGATVLLTATALLFGSSLGVLLGVIAARQRRSMISGLVSIGGVAGYAVPSFWLAQLAILLFGVELGWLPLSGMVSIRTPREGFDHVIDVANHLILPALVLSVGHVALTSRFTRSNVLDVLEQDYVRTAHAKGLPERSVVIDHVLRNALLPVVSVIGYNLGFLLSGSALVETVFGWPGLGRLLYDSLFRRDNAVLLGVFLTTNLAAILGNLIADLVSTWLDPRLARQV